MINIGDTRFNSDTRMYEYYTGKKWKALMTEEAFDEAQRLLKKQLDDSTIRNDNNARNGG